MFAAQPFYHQGFGEHRREIVVADVAVQGQVVDVRRQGLSTVSFQAWLFSKPQAIRAIVVSTLSLQDATPSVFLIPLLLEMGTLGWVDSYQALILSGSMGAFGIFWMCQQIGAVSDASRQRSGLVRSRAVLHCHVPPALRTATGLVGQ